MERHADMPSRPLRALFKGVGEQIERLRFRGCLFINLAKEFPDRQNPGTAIAFGNKKELRDRLRAIARTLGARNPQRLGDQLALPIDGAYGRAVTLGPAGLKRELIDTAAVVIDAKLGSSRGPANVNGQKQIADMFGPQDTGSPLFSLKSSHIVAMKCARLPRQFERGDELSIGAGEGNRTLVFSLEGCCSTIELHPRR
jgi:hypothetical protein